MGGRRETIVECKDTKRNLATGFFVTAVLDDKPYPIEGCTMKVSKDRQNLELKGPGGINISKKLKLFRFCVRGWKATAFTAKHEALRPQENECMTLVYEDGFDGYQATLGNNQVHPRDSPYPLFPPTPALHTHALAVLGRRQEGSALGFIFCSYYPTRLFRHESI